MYQVQDPVVKFKNQKLIHFSILPLSLCMCVYLKQPKFRLITTKIIFGQDEKWTFSGLGENDHSSRLDTRHFLLD